MIAIIDSGGANIASVRFALERCGETAHLTADHAEIESADKVILPGVGMAATAMACCCPQGGGPNAPCGLGRHDGGRL